MWFKFLVVAILVVGVSYVFYEPLDGPFEQPIKTRAYLALFKLGALVSDGLQFLGLASRVDGIRFAYDIPYHLLTQDDPELKISDDVIDGVKVRIYEPHIAGSELRSAVIYFHGGGWVIGSINLYDLNTRDLAKALSAVVISVDYRMAPEVKFPVPFHDCFAVTKYVLQNANKFGLDGTRIAVAGDSAGGNLAAAVSLRLRDENITPKLKSQVLIYPVVQALDLQTPSYQQNFYGPLLPLSAMAYFWSMYIKGNTDLSDILAANQHRPHNSKELRQLDYLNYDELPEHHLEKPFERRPQDAKYDHKIWKELEDTLLNPYLAPLMADDLSDLPDACVLTCHLDVLRDEGTWYAQRLDKAGNKVTYIERRVGFHAMFNNHNGPFAIKEGKELFQDVVECLKTALK